MRYLYYLKIVLNNISRDLKKYILVICSLIVTISLFGLSLYMLFYTKKDEIAVNKCLDGKIDKVGCVSWVDNNIADNADIATMINQNDEIVKKIKHIPGLQAGCFYDSGYSLSNDNGCFDDLIDIQKKYKNKDVYESADSGEKIEILDCIAIKNDVFNMYNIEFFKGEYKQKNDDCVYIYLGYEFRNIPVGTEYVNGKGIKYKVAGIIRENTYIVDDYYYKLGVYPDTSTISLDSKVLFSGNIENVASEMFIKVADGYDFYEVADNIVKELKNDGVIVTCDKLTDVVEYNTQGMDDFINEMIRLASIIMIVTLIIQIAIQFVVTMKNNYTYAVLLCNGFVMKDIVMICVVDAIIKIIISISVTYAITMAWVNYDLSDYLAIKVAGKIVVTQVMPICLLVLVLIMAIVNTYSCILIKKHSKSELIRS